LGLGGTLAKYAAEGVETYLVCATRGERGWAGDEKDNPGLTALGQIRTQELLAAAEVLGLREVQFLDYIDGDLDQAPPAEAIARLVSHIRRVRPQVIVTFPPDGSYGHPDHIAISQFSAAAIVQAASAAYPDPQPPHTVAKFYFMADSQSIMKFFESLFGPITFEVDGVVRQHSGWDEWAITTHLDTAAHWQTVMRAIECHRTQIAHFHLDTMPEAHQRTLTSTSTFYRVFSLVNGGRKVESDLFEGLRQ
jgi:LmbE family N-acetylglucosaminyl deacetylase